MPRVRTRKLPDNVRAAIKCGPVPVLRDWRSLPVEKLTRAERNMAFCETHARVPEGPLVGRPIRLAEFQEAFFYSVFDNPAGTRKAILSMARKNAKTATIACIALCFIAGPEKVLNSRINSGALSRKQAAEVYNYASKMISLSPTLGKVCRLVPSQKTIFGLVANVEYSALAAEGRTTHGGSPLIAIMDEIGQIRGPRDAFYEALTTGQGAYDNAMLFLLSTQAPSDADLFSIEIDSALRDQPETTVLHLYTAPEDADLMDRNAWLAANPAMGLFRSETDIAEKARDAEAMPSSENGFRVLFLNQRVNAVSPFVSPQVWAAGNREPASLEGLACYGGLDLSATTDLTAFVLIARDEEGGLHVHPHFWIPENSVEAASKRDKQPYDVWVKQGLMRTTPGNVIDYSFVARDIGEICAGLRVEKIAFDRWRMDRLKTAMEQAGIELPLESFGQGFASMSPVLDALEAELLQSRLAHGGHPVLSMCAGNAIVVRDASGNRKLDKSQTTGRIDGMVALAMAVGVESTGKEEGGSYLDSGPIVFV